MKLPIIRQLYQGADAQKIENAIDVLEVFTEARGVSEEELNLAGELITNLCGALEVHALVNSGQKESDALNAFAKKVMGSIDR